MRKGLWEITSCVLPSHLLGGYWFFLQMLTVLCQVSIVSISTLLVVFPLTVMASLSRGMLASRCV